MKESATNLYSSIQWLSTFIVGRLNRHFKDAKEIEIGTFTLYSEESGLPRFIEIHKPNIDEFVIFMLALTPHIQPDYFSKLIAEHLPEGGDFPELGGIKGTNHRGILPTGETAQFILAGDDIEKRLEVQRLLGSEHWFAKEQILWLESVREGEPFMSGRLILNSEVVEQLTLGTLSKPRFSIEFPAEHIETEMEWDDLVLPKGTLQQIREIENWIRYNDTLLNDWGMKKKIKPGYRALFYGPPGTGKTLTASLLGKQTGKDVFRVDLSRVVSKYIGETEKHLSKLFDKAENKNWILFFDEAEALFGKRTEIHDAHDKYANQEVAYLLQRVESYNGLVILASNRRNNIDEAFARRFQTIIHFPMPRPDERYKIWAKTVPPQMQVEPDIDWQMISTRFELSGAGILNVVHYCAVESLADPSAPINAKRLEAAIMREFVKEGKMG